MSLLEIIQVVDPNNRDRHKQMWLEKPTENVGYVQRGYVKYGKKVVHGRAERFGAHMPWHFYPDPEPVEVVKEQQEELPPVA